MARLQIVREEDGFDLPPLGVEDGTTFGYFDRMNIVGLDPTGKYVTDLSDWEARDMHEMLTKDYRAQQIEKVLSLPLISASFTIQPAKGDSGEAEWLKAYWDADSYAGGCRTSLQQIISLMTTAIFYKRAYFEKVWRKGYGQFEGKFVYDDVCWRPQTTCRLMRDPINGRFRGFEQEAYFVGSKIKSTNKWPIQIPPSRAFVYTHGMRRDPLNGSSDMEVAYWAWKTKQKILMLWFQFLQGVSLPRIVVKATDTDTARSIAKEIARMKSSGVLPLGVPGSPTSVAIDTLDASGKGADQFQHAINWLDTAATDSVLAGFLNLTGSANMSHFGGSYALSKDASDFFLQSVESKAREMEEQIRAGLFAPLIRHNFGPDAAVPRLVFEPLNDIDKATAVELLKTAMAAPPGGPVPTSFIADLAGQVASYLGLDGEGAREDFKKSFDAAAAQAQAKALADGTPGGGSPVGQQVAGLAGAVQAAHKAIQAGVNPAKAHADAKKAVGGDAKAAGAAAKADSAKQALMTKHAKNVIAAKTGGEASLSNEDTDLAKLSKAERDALPSSAFVFPDTRRYPIQDKAHAHAALKDAAGTADEAAVRAAVKARYGWDLSNEESEMEYDLAGFNPAEPRAGGRWTTGQGDQGKQKGKRQGENKPGTMHPKKGHHQKPIPVYKAGPKQGPTHAQLLHERKALTAQVHTLTAVLARLQPAGAPGVHHGAAGVHRGPAGTKSKASAPKTSTKSSTSTSTGSKTGPVPLAVQVQRLQARVQSLKAQIAAAQRRRAKK